MRKILLFVILIFPSCILFGQSNQEWVKEFMRLNNSPPTPQEAEVFMAKRDSLFVLDLKKSTSDKMKSSALVRDSIVLWLDNWIKLERNFPHLLLDAHLDVYFEYNEKETLEYLMKNWDIVRHNTSVNIDSFQPYSTAVLTIKRYI